MREYDLEAVLFKGRNQTYFNNCSKVFFDFFILLTYSLMAPNQFSSVQLLSRVQLFATP